MERNIESEWRWMVRDIETSIVAVTSKMYSSYKKDVHKGAIPYLVGKYHRLHGHKQGSDNKDYVEGYNILNEFMSEYIQNYHL